MNTQTSTALAEIRTALHKGDLFGAQALLFDCDTPADYAEGALQLARAHRRARDTEAAIAVLRQALETGDPVALGPRHHAELADILVSDRATDLALEAVDAGRAAFPDDRGLILRRLRILAQLGRVAEVLGALSAVRTDMVLKSGDETFVTQALRSLSACKDLSTAQAEQLDDLGAGFLSAYPEFPGLNSHAGDLARKRGDWATALTHYERAFDVTRSVSTRAALRDRMSEALAALKDHDPSAAAGKSLPTPAITTPFQVAALTNVFNENRNLPVWLAHYGAQIGVRNCTVLDHGSDDGSTDDLGGAGFLRLPRRTFYNERHRMALINQTANNLLNYYDAVIYTDCDEMLVADPDRHENLLAFARDLKRPVAHAVGFNLRHDPLSEPPIRTDRPILSQRTLAQFVSAMCKPLVIRKPVSWGGGFHSCEHKPVFSDLYLFHLRKVDRDWGLERMQTTRNVKFEREGGGKHHRLSDDELARYYDTVHKLPVREDFDYADDLAAHKAAIGLSHSGRHFVRNGIQSRTLYRVPERFRQVF